MCSTCDCDPDALANLEFRQSSTEPKSCRRCGSKGYIILDKIHVDCKSCFLESCNKKLRSTIGKSRLMSNNDPILIAYSGSASSTALMDLINSSIEFNFRREQKFRPSIVHVDMQSVINPHQDTSQRLANLESFLNETRSIYPKWPVYWTTIETVARERPNCDSEQFYLKYEGNLVEVPSSTYLFDTKALNCLQTTLSNFDLTDKQNYLRKSNNDLIVEVADSINKSANPEDRFRCIFNASSANQLATNLLVDVILGEGATCHSTVNICDSRLSVPIVRPMRDFSKKEIAFYLRARQLTNRPQINLATLDDCKASIQKLTELFLSKLSLDYPSTYSTLLRTGNKLQDS